MRLTVVNIVAVPLMALGLVWVALTGGDQTFVAAAAALAAAYAIVVFIVARGRPYQTGLGILVGWLATAGIAWIIGRLFASAL